MDWEGVSQSLAIGEAMHFLESGQEAEGYWSDFLTAAGESTDWVTGYVGVALSKIGDSASALSRAYRWLVNNQFPQGGWGYHRKAIVDADSTSWCLLFMASLGGSEVETWANAVETLRGHQSSSDGGFRTYSEPSPIGEYMGMRGNLDFSGWCSSQLCVTAVGIQALLKSGLECNSEEVQRALAYIRRQQDDAGYWDAYWWDGRMYSTYHCIKALKMAGADEDERHCQKATQWLLRVQLEDGSWNNGVSGEGRPFHTALAVQALLEEGGKAACEAASRGIRWLLQEQLDDGSWQSYAILRIPAPWTRYPWKESVWSNAFGGTNIIVRDQHRLFTTATVLGSLLAYRTAAEKVGIGASHCGSLSSL